MSKVFIATANAGKAHDADIFSVSACNSFTVSCSGDGYLKVWDNKLLDNENQKISHILTLSISPDCTMSMSCKLLREMHLNYALLLPLHFLAIYSSIVSLEKMRLKSYIREIGSSRLRHEKAFLLGIKMGCLK